MSSFLKCSLRRECWAVNWAVYASDRMNVVIRWPLLRMMGLSSTPVPSEQTSPGKVQGNSSDELARGVSAKYWEKGQFPFRDSALQLSLQARPYFFQPASPASRLPVQLRA